MGLGARVDQSVPTRTWVSTFVEHDTQRIQITAWIGLLCEWNLSACRRANVEQHTTTMNLTLSADEVLNTTRSVRMIEIEPRSPSHAAMKPARPRASTSESRCTMSIIVVNML